MAPDFVYIALLSTGSVLLMIPWIIILRQMCFVADTNKKDRFHKTIYVLIFLSLAIALHTCLYILTMEGNIDYGYGITLFRLTYFIEAITIIYGFHIFRVLGFSFADQLFVNNLMSQERPKWITYSLYTSEYIIALSAFICYMMGLFLFENIKFVYVFYIIFNALILFIAFSAYYVIQKLQNMLKEVSVNTDNEQVMRSSIRAVNILKVMVISMVIGSIAHTLLDIDSLEGYVGIDQTLSQCALHSVFLVVMEFVFLAMIIEKNKNLCYVNEHSLYVGCKQKCCKTGKDHIELDEMNVVLLTETNKTTTERITVFQGE